METIVLLICLFLGSLCAQLQDANDTQVATNATEFNNSSTEVINITEKSTETIGSSTTPSTATTTTTTEIYKNPLDEIKTYKTDGHHCDCDLKGSSCDINCCCDSVCSDSERRLFSHCMERKDMAYESQYCYHKNIVYSNWTQHEMVRTTSGLFCIAWDNVQKRDLLPDRKLITSPTEEKHLVPKHGYGWSPGTGSGSRRSGPTHVLLTALRWGEPLRLISVGADNVQVFENWKLPASLLTADGVCDSFQPVLYLKEAHFSCLRVIEDLTIDCQSNPFLGSTVYSKDLYVDGKFPGSHYEESISINSLTQYLEGAAQGREGVPIPATGAGSGSQGALSGSLILKSRCISVNECIEIFPDEPSPKEPQWTLTKEKTKVCHHVVREVNYEINYHPMDGITQIKVSFELMPLREGETMFRQRFNIAFKQLVDKNSSRDEEEVIRSGNPGYLLGRPILATKSMVSIKTKQANESIGSYHELLVPRKESRDGTCDLNSTATEAIQFGVNLRNGCMFNVSALPASKRYSCFHLQQYIVGILDTNEDLNMVGIYGNSNITAARSWVPIMTERVPRLDSVPKLTVDGRCLSLITGFSYHIYYARVGSKSDPQSKIMGVMKRYQEPIDVPLRCHSAFCTRKESGILIQVSTSVSFYDMTYPSRPSFAPPPVFTFQLPHDFFYPFLTNSGIQIKAFHTLLRTFLFVICLYCF